MMPREAVFYFFLFTVVLSIAMAAAEDDTGATVTNAKVKEMELPDKIGSGTVAPTSLEDDGTKEKMPQEKSSYDRSSRDPIDDDEEVSSPDLAASPPPSSLSGVGSSPRWRYVPLNSLTIRDLLKNKGNKGGGATTKSPGSTEKTPSSTSSGDSTVQGQSATPPPPPPEKEHWWAALSKTKKHKKKHQNHQSQSAKQALEGTPSLFRTKNKKTKNPPQPPSRLGAMLLAGGKRKPAGGPVTQEKHRNRNR